MTLNDEEYVSISPSDVLVQKETIRTILQIGINAYFIHFYCCLLYFPYICIRNICNLYGKRTQTKRP